MLTVNYQRIHNQIIEKRRLEIPLGYKEIHHIIPRSFGGTDDNDNVIALTAREHFLCHYLFIKIYSKDRDKNFYKAVHAFMMMRCSNSFHERITSRLFEKYREEHREIMSKLQTGENNSQYGKIWISYNDLKISKKINKELYPLYYEQGWAKGRCVWNKDSYEIRICKKCNNEFFSNSKNNYCSKECRPTTKGISFSLSEQTKNRMSESKKELYKDPTKNPAYGRKFKHSEETKRKISFSISNKLSE
jgi:hypothetical protein